MGKVRKKGLLDQDRAYAFNLGTSLTPQEADPQEQTDRLGPPGNPCFLAPGPGGEP